MATARALYIAGNAAGLGYAPYTDEAGDDTIDSAVSAAFRDGWTLVLPRESSDDVAVLRDEDGVVMAIGGTASGEHAWAVILVESVSLAQLRALRSEAASAGDAEVVKLCDRAIDGDADARGECGLVISDAAMRSQS